MAGPGRPGRLSANAAGSPEPDSAPGSSGFARSLRTRLKPPSDLDPEARAVFIDVVVNSNPEHFQPSDVPLLCVYAEAVVQARACAKLLSEGTGSDLTIKAQRNALSAVFQLSMRLRVSRKRGRCESRSALTPGRRPCLTTTASRWR